MSTCITWDTLSIDQYRSIEKIKKQLRKGNWRYLREHPEVRAIIRVLLKKVINDKPEDVVEYAIDLFNHGRTPLLNTMINGELKIVEKLMKRTDVSDYDGELLFGESESSHSLQSTSSADESINSMLSYALVLRDREKDTV